MDAENLTGEERRAIASLERLAKRWPRSLMLFSASGSLLVLRNDGHSVERLGSRDAAEQYATILASIDGIPNDGGDP